MARLQFPKVDPSREPVFRNLNGDGGRVQLLVSMPILLLIVVGAWWPQESGEGLNWFGVFGVIALVWYSARLFTVTVVDYSSDALRIRRRGREYVIPFSEVIAVRESGRFEGMGSIGSTHSRYVTVRLDRRYPFGFEFSFYTKNEYGDFEGLSGVAKLIESFAERARRGEGKS